MKRLRRWWHTHTWFQNLNEDGKHLFHFRGSITLFGKRFGYELCSEWGFGANITQGEELTLHLHLLYPSIWLHFPIYGGDKTLSFDFRHWTCYWTLWMPQFEWNSTDPWWRNGSFDIPSFLFGKLLYFSEEAIAKNASDIWFEFRGKEYKADRIEFKQSFRFRSRIPFALWHTEWWCCKIDISKPPLHAGKGENSYDCDDDGSYGMSFGWTGSTIPLATRDQLLKEALAFYCEHVSKDIKRYGKAANDRELSGWHVGYKYIGQKIPKEQELKKVSK